MAPRAIQREQKREQILRAALKVFARQGLYNFKVIEIAEQAGVGKVTIYEYFPSKEELMRGAINLMMADYHAFAARRLAGVSAPIDQIRSIITTSCEFFARPKWRLKLMFDLWSAGVPRDRKQPHLFDARKWYTHMCESLIADCLVVVNDVTDRITAELKVIYLKVALTDTKAFLFKYGKHHIRRIEPSRAVDPLLYEIPPASFECALVKQSGTRNAFCGVQMLYYFNFL